MMNLVPLEACPLEAFDAIIQNKQGARPVILRRLRPRLMRLYRAYANARRELSELPQSYAYLGVRVARAAIVGSHAFRAACKRSPPPRSSFEAPEHKALLDCYDNETKGLSEMLARIRKLQPAKQRWLCQYCCGMSRSSTWDHYLNKAHFPEFAVYAPNLIPACGECNGFKAAWIKYGKRTCVNFYYDRIVATRPLMAAKITIGEDGDPEVKFFLVRRNVLRTRFGRLFARHFRMLQLERRLGETAESKLDIIRVDLWKWVSEGRFTVEDLQKDLASKAAQLQRSYGANHFDAALYRAAAASRELIEYYLRGGPR